MQVKVQFAILKKKKEVIINKESITKVCIDDFAIKKRQTYGTIMIDIVYDFRALLKNKSSGKLDDWEPQI